jgi:hypothetical protein
MNGRFIFRGIIILLSFFTLAAFSSTAFAQAQIQKPVQKAPEKTTPQPPASDEIVFKKKIAEPSGGLITGISGGYFSALGSMGSILKPGWYAKAFVYNNAIEGKALGVGFEAGYAKLKDVDNRGSVTFMPAMVYATLTWNIFGVIDMQPKFGAGITAMIAKIDNGITIKNKSTYDFTLSGGFAVLKTFLKNYFAGVDYQYYYFFERNPSKAHAVNFFAGYKF